MMERLFNFLSLTASSKFTLLKIIMRSGFFLKDKKVNLQSIFVLGNGPSFKKQYESLKGLLIDNKTLCVNGFSLSDQFVEIKPSYYLVASPGFYRHDSVDYNVQVRKNIIDAIVKKTVWPMVFFVPYPARKSKSFIKHIESNDSISIRYYNTTPIEGLQSVNEFFYRHGLGTPRPHNVLIPSLLRAINIGCKKIFLLGADHSWLPLLNVNEKNEVLLDQKHFYDEGKTTSKQMHKNEGRGNRKLHEVLHKWMLSFRSYHELNAYAIKRNTAIINLTPGSFIDAFERGSIEEIEA